MISLIYAFIPSLLAYEAAKSEMKTFYESTLSDRIANFTKAKESAIRKANLFGTPITIAPISADRLFSSDHSLSLTASASHGGGDQYFFDDEDSQFEEEGRLTHEQLQVMRDAESDNIAIKEYFKSRGAQSHQLEEDSRVLSPPSGSPKLTTQSPKQVKRDKSQSTLFKPLEGKRPHRRSIQINGTSSRFSSQSGSFNSGSAGHSPSNRSHEDEDNYSWNSTARSEVAVAAGSAADLLQFTRSPTAAALASRGVHF
jgi:hypothetical protein